MMKRIFSRILLGVGCLSAYACGRTVPAEHEVAVVPQPAAVECGDGTFRLTGDTPVRMVGGAESDARMEWVADALDEVVEPLFGRKLSVGTGDASIPGAVNIGRADTLPQEAYRLTVADDRIEILAGGPEGAFHAVQTLRQLLPAAAFGEDGLRAVELPAVGIDDRPALAYRGLMLDVARRITECDRKLRREGLDMKVGVLENLGINVTGKTLGIIGMGRIGKALAKRANACGMEVLYHNRRQLYVEEETKLNVTYVSKEELLSQSDFVSLNAPYTPETYHIIGEAELKQMKPTAVLINTGRGPLVDEKALVRALKDGTIHGAGLDVFEFGDYPSPELLEMENVVLTPHIGTQTLETRIIMARTVCNNVIGFLEGDRPVSRVLRP